MSKKPIKAEISSPVYQVCYQPFNVCLLLIELKDLIDLFAAELIIGVRERDFLKEGKRNYSFNIFSF